MAASFQKLAQQPSKNVSSSHVPKTMAIPKSLSDVNRLLKEKPPSVQEQQKNIKEEADTALEQEPRNPFDEQKLQGVLEEIILDFKEKGKNMETAILKRPFGVNKERITFFLNGEIQKDIFLKIRHEITLLIRKSLDNHKVDLAFEIKEDTVNPSKMLYTSTDKLNYLREKSAALRELQNRFGLETDF